MPFAPFYASDARDFFLYEGDCTELLPAFTAKFDLVFADPPYFLSNDGLTIKAGKVTSVNKGSWDKKSNHESTAGFTQSWLDAVRGVMEENATVWISCTSHNLFETGSALEKLDFKILNIITWQKTNPPPNFSCRYFTHSTEFIIWARKNRNKPHYFNYDLMKEINSGKQMKDVWTLSAVSKRETRQGKHPTQKPLPLLSRIILASSQPGDNVLDPFTGSSTTGIAANLQSRNFYGIDLQPEFLELSKNRRLGLEADRKSLLAIL